MKSAEAVRPLGRTALVAGLLTVLMLCLPALAEARWKGPERGYPWPPATGGGMLFAHFGEEHVNDDDGATLLPKVVHESIRYRPRLVTMSGDKVDDGATEELELWADVMGRFDRRGVPWLAAVGNHDRKAPPGSPGGVSPSADLTPYKEFFADRPYPMGDATPYPDRRLKPRVRPDGDPEGASSHYFADYGYVRFIFIDNSCWSIIGCDSTQNPSAQNAGGTEPQFDFMRRVAQEASDQGKHAFVVMHMPTRDPRDQSYVEPISSMHTMGKGPLGTADNTTFEQVAAETGVDGVFVAHIKGQFLYTGQGGVPYYIDGGAGGELYTTGPVGVDHGYWHGFRLIRVRRAQIAMDVVPIFVRDGITIAGPKRVRAGREVSFEAFGRQPVFNDPAKVEALELRDPDPVRPSGGSGTSAFAALGSAAPWIGPSLALLLALGVGMARDGGRMRRALAPVGLAGLMAAGAVGVAAAQQSEPTTTPLESLPVPARMWTTEKPHVLRPVATEADDPRRHRRTQTDGGTFRALCPGVAKIRVASGWEVETKRVRVLPPTPPGLKRKCARRR